MRQRVPYAKAGRPPPRSEGPAPDLDALPVVPRLLAYQRLAGNAAVGGLLDGSTVQRQPAAAGTRTAATGTPTFAEVWEEFVVLRNLSSPKLAGVLPRLVAAMTGPDAVSHGIELTQLLLDRGQPGLARDVLGRMEAEYRLRQLRFHLKQTGAVAGVPGADDLPKPGLSRDPVPGMGGHPADGLLERAQAAAARDDDATALALLTRVYLMLQLQLEREGPRGAGQAGDDPAVAKVRAQATRAVRYSALAGIYTRMRLVLGLHPALAAERAARRDAAGAARAQAAGARLRQTLDTDYLVADAEAMIADVTPVGTGSGSALRIHGDRGQTDVTQLPGQLAPKEVAADAYQTSPMADVHAALGAQVDLTHDLLALPAVRQAFPGGVFDLTRMADRLKIWKAVFTSAPGGSDGLTAVVAVIRRFLKAYTVHTEYNIRDFGAVSYVKAEERDQLPVDLAGRLERDCGVYALTVASEVAKTARTQGLDLDFQLVTTLDHAMLVIRRAAGDFFVVSNDEIKGPLTGDVAQQVGTFVGAGRQVGVMPAMTFELGSTGKGKGKKSYSDESAWTDYKKAQFGLTGPDRNALYRQFYADQLEIERLTVDLEEALGRRPGRGVERDLLVARAAALRPTYARLAFLWQQWGTQRTWSAQSAKHGMTLASGPLTLARVGMMLVRMQKLGLRLDPLDDNVLRVVDAVPVLQPPLRAYVARGAPPVF